jgi:LysR family transcriptional regulator, low CO2-responsive transcriptional regulator
MILSAGVDTPSKLDIHSLIVFYYVASEESVTAAAEKLFLTQPTVTYHIRSLEKNIGLKLLDVRKQKVCLTEAGKGLFKYVYEINRQMTSAEKYLDNLKEASLRIGTSTTFSHYVSEAASEFEKLSPRVKLVIRTAASYEVIEDVLSSRVDLGIVVSVDYASPRLRVEPLSTRERLVLVAAPSNPIAQKKHLEFVNLCGCPLVLGPETSATRQIILKRLMTGGCHAPSPIIMEVNNIECGISLVENGSGVGLQHIRCVEREIREGRLKILPLSADIWVGADALLHADTPEHPMTGKFIALLRKVFETNGEKVAVGASRV